MAGDPLPSGTPFPLRLRRSERAKRLRIIVRADGVECVLPAVCPERLARDFVHQHQAWVTRKYHQAIAKVPARTFWEELAASEVASFPLEGVATRFLCRQDPAANRARLSYDGHDFRLVVPRQAPGAAEIEQAVFAWTRGWLGYRLDAMIRGHADRIGVRPRLLRIKRMRTRWGSCGARNDVNLNWLLIAVPQQVLEYVVVHELCHIRHRDHSTRFWELVSRHCPEFMHSRGWLKANGAGVLHRFGLPR